MKIILSWTKSEINATKIQKNVFYSMILWLNRLQNIT